MSSIWQKDVKDIFKIKKKDKGKSKKLKPRITIDINEETIDILVGTKEEILRAEKLNTPEGAFQNGLIMDTKKIAKVIKDYFKMVHVRAKDVYFIVHGDDIITRYIEFPILGEEAMNTAVKIEIRKSYPDKESLYYYSYQLIEHVQGRKASVGKYMVVMCRRKKIDKYIELCDLLNLNLKCIDLSSNSLRRVICKLNENKTIRYEAVLNVKNNETTLSIINENLLQMEKRINFGIANIKRVLDIDTSVAYAKLKNINFESKNLFDYESEQIKGLLDTLSTVLNGVIKFYFSGKAENNLNKMYLVGDLNYTKGIKNYFENYFENKISLLNELSIEIDRPKEVNLIEYINCYGLLLRED